jgi:hypothetical protein
VTAGTVLCDSGSDTSLVETRGVDSLHTVTLTSYVVDTGAPNHTCKTFFSKLKCIYIEECKKLEYTNDSFLVMAVLKIMNIYTAAC